MEVEAKNGTDSTTGFYFWLGYLDMRMGNPPTYILFAVLTPLYLWIWICEELLMLESEDVEM